MYRSCPDRYDECPIHVPFMSSLGGHADDRIYSVTHSRDARGARYLRTLLRRSFGALVRVRIVSLVGGRAHVLAGDNVLTIRKLQRQVSNL